jgi:hypothetical protein
LSHWSGTILGENLFLIIYCSLDISRRNCNCNGEEEGNICNNDNMIFVDKVEDESDANEYQTD